MIFILTAAIILVFSFIKRDYKAEIIRQFAKEKDAISFFYPLALYIYDFCHKHFKLSLRNATKQDLASLKQDNVYAYIAKKGSVTILIILAACILAFTADLSARRYAIKNNTIKRPAANKESETYNLIVESEGKKYNINADISSVKLTEKEVMECFKKGYEEIKRMLPADNKSLDEVNSNLKFITQCTDNIVSVEWKSSDRDIVDDYGNVFNKEIETDREIMLTATLKYMDYSADYDIYVTVKPYDYSAAESFEKNIDTAIKNAQEENPYKDEVVLPNQIDGKDVTYKSGEKSNSTIIFIVGAAIGIIMLIMPDRTLKAKMIKRNRQMLIDYSEIVLKLTLLIGSGMTVRRAWERIVMQYKKTGKFRYAYEEMAVTQNRLEAGFSETGEYEAFAKRCKIHEYTKLAAILTQNLRKGNEGLTGKLSLEVYTALEQRKSMARKMGEEASTKLLMPMMLMLVIVIAIVVIPVFISL